MGGLCGRRRNDNYDMDVTTHGSGWGVSTSTKKTGLFAFFQQIMNSELIIRFLFFQADTKLINLKQAIIKTMKKEDHDDGSLGPIFIRLAWHSCATYDVSTKTGGSSAGATMRFPPEANDPENIGLELARRALDPVHDEFPWISIADLWILAGTMAIEELGGPKVEVRFGRKDHPGPESPIQPGRIPNPEYGLETGVTEDNKLKNWQKLAAYIRAKFDRMGFIDQEAVALVCGGHVFGRCHVDNSGYAGAWVENPLEFSNEFAADLVGDDWRLVDGSDEKDRKEIPAAVCPVAGKRQYVSKPHDKHPQMMLPSDMM